MTFLQRLAILSLIHIKEERYLLKKYSPIGLTNKDHRVIAYIFSQRLPNIMDDYIGKEQTAYIKSIYIGTNDRLILDIFSYCESNNKEGLLLILDLKKAFDSIEGNFLFKTNFGPTSIKCVNILYKNAILRLKNNGWNTRTCRMNRKIEQRCPIWAILMHFCSRNLIK